MKEGRVRPEQARQPYQQQEKLKLRIKQNLYLRREEKAGIDHERGCLETYTGYKDVSTETARQPTRLDKPPTKPFKKKIEVKNQMVH